MARVYNGKCLSFIFTLEEYIVTRSIPLEDRINKNITVGVTKEENPSGRIKEVGPAVSTTYSAYQQDVVAGQAFDRPAALIAEATQKIKFVEYLDKNNTALYDIYTANPLRPASDVIIEFSKEQAIETLEFIKSSLEGEREKEGCIKENVEGIEAKAQKAIAGFFDALLDAGVDLALSLVNDLLPPDFKLGVGITKGEDGSITVDSVSVGPVGYNAKDNTISLDDKLYDGLVQEGIDAVNNVLPDFLQLDISSSSLNFGDIVVDLDELEGGGSVDVLPEISVREDNGDIKVKVGDKEYSVVNIGKRVAEGAIRRYVLPEIAGGIQSINRQMPFGFKIGISFNNGSLLPTVQLGPITLDIANGALNLDAQSLLNTGIGMLNGVVNQGISKLPPPIQGIARSLYKSLNLGGMVSQAILKPSPDKSLNINESCARGSFPGTPAMSSSAPGGAKQTPSDLNYPEPNEDITDLPTNPPTTA